MKEDLPRGLGMVGKGFALILDLDRVLSADEVADAEAAAARAVAVEVPSGPPAPAPA